MARQNNPQHGPKQQHNIPKNENFNRKRGGQDRPHPALSRIEYVDLFSSARIEGHYRGYDLIFDGRNLLKQPHGSNEKIEPDDSEKARFIQDLRVVIEHDPRIAGFIQRNL